VIAGRHADTTWRHEPAALVAAIQDMSSGLAEMAAPRVTDADVIARSLEHPEAFRELFDRHYGRIRRYAAARIGDAADDVAAETFAKAFGNRGRYRQDRPDAAPWLLGIATNLIRHRRRSELARLRAVARLPTGCAADEPATPADNRGDLARALARVHRRDRDVLLLYALEDLSYAEIAIALGIPTGTVRSRLNRARQIVREALES
jgi:RNA polymerase sigma-70 factor (ECF subfamily)